MLHLPSNRPSDNGHAAQFTSRLKADSETSARCRLIVPMELLNELVGFSKRYGSQVHSAIVL